MATRRGRRSRRRPPSRRAPAAPRALARPAPPARCSRSAASLLGTLPAALLLLPGGLDAPRAFWDATFGYQLSRPSPFSLWHWGIYPGFPDLRLVQIALEVLLAIAAIACLWYPRRLDAVRLAALSAALVIGFQLCLSYWFYTYIPWFFPFAMIALCAPSRVR